MSDKIALYQLGFYICMAASIFFLLMSVLLFFRFGILSVLKLRTGIGQQKTVREANRANEKSGRLKYNSMALGERTPPSGLAPPPASTEPLDVKAGQPNEPAPPEPPTPPWPAGANTPLKPPVYAANPAAGETVPLSAVNKASGSSAELPPGFTVVKSIMLVHTEEPV